MSIGGFEVPYHVYRYVVVNSKHDVEVQFGADVWTSDNADTAKETLEANVKELYEKYTHLSL